MGISHSFPLGPHFIQGTHPLSGLQPRFHQGQSLGGGSSFSVGGGSVRTGSPSFVRLLQPVICGDESLRVVETGNRPLAAESEDSEDILQDGDSSVCASVSTAWRLDGFSRLEGCILAGSDASEVSQVSQVRGLWEGLPVQSSLFWTLHGSAGFHLGHCSCFSFSSPIRHQTSLVSRRLVNPGLLPRAGSPCSGCSSPALFISGDSRQLGEVSACSNSTDGLSGGPVGLCLFQGFSCPETSREASLNWQRILVLRATACVILAGASGCSVVHDSARSGRQASDEISAVCSQAFLGSSRSVDSCPMDSGGTSRPRMVTQSQVLGARHLPRSSVPTARLVVRRFGRGLGSSFRRRHCFRPMVSRRLGDVYQRQGALGHRKGSEFLCSSSPELLCRSVRGQLHRNSLSPESKAHSVSTVECHRTADFVLDGVSSGDLSSSVYHELSQCSCGLCLAPTKSWVPSGPSRPRCFKI